MAQLIEEVIPHNSTFILPLEVVWIICDPNGKLEQGRVEWLKSIEMKLDVSAKRSNRKINIIPREQGKYPHGTTPSSLKVALGLSYLSRTHFQIDSQRTVLFGLTHGDTSAFSFYWNPFFKTSPLGVSRNPTEIKFTAKVDKITWISSQSLKMWSKQMKKQTGRRWL